MLALIELLAERFLSAASFVIRGLLIPLAGTGYTRVLIWPLGGGGKMGAGNGPLTF